MQANGNNNDKTDLDDNVSERSYVNNTLYSIRQQHICLGVPQAPI